MKFGKSVYQSDYTINRNLYFRIQFVFWLLKLVSVLQHCYNKRMLNNWLCLHFGSALAISHGAFVIWWQINLQMYVYHCLRDLNIKIYFEKILLY